MWESEKKFHEVCPTTKILFWIITEKNAANRLFVENDYCEELEVDHGRHSEKNFKPKYITTTSPTDLIIFLHFYRQTNLTTRERRRWGT